MADKIQIRRDTASNWTSVNPTLASGELGIETDTTRMKVGTGSTAWTSLAYIHTTGIADYAPLAGATFTGAVSGTTFTGSGTVTGATVTGTTVNASTALQIGGTAITSTPAELNILDGVTATAAELNYVDGVTSNIQTQLSGKADSTLSFVASGAIASGKPCILKTDGKAAQITGDLSGLESQAEVLSAVSPGPGFLVYEANSSKFVYFYSAVTTRYLTAIVGSISGTTITWGSPVTVHGADCQIGNYRPTATVDTTNNKVVVVYHTGNSWAAGVTAVKAGTVSGSGTGATISFGPAVTIATYDSNATDNEHSSAPNDQIVYTGSGKVVVCMRRQLNSNTYDFATAGVGVYDSGNNRYNFTGFGTSENAHKQSGSNANWQNGNVGGYAAIVYYGVANKFAYFCNTSTNINTMKIGTVSGTSVTFGDYVQIQYDQASKGMGVTYDAAAGKIIATYFDSGNDINYYRVITVDSSSDAITLGAETRLDADSSAKGDEYWINAQIEHAVGTGGGRSAVLYIQDDSIDATYYKTVKVSGSTLTMDTSTKLYDEAAELRSLNMVDAGSGKVVILYAIPGATTGNLVQNRLYSKVLRIPVTETNLTSTNYLGIADEAIANTASGKIMLKGGVSTKLSGLTIGTDYYVGEDGNFTTTSTNNQEAGKALTATTLMMKGH